MQPVQSLLVTPGKEVRGVVLQGGQEIRSKIVLSNATAKVTFLDLLEKVSLFFNTITVTGGLSMHLKTCYFLEFPWFCSLRKNHALNFSLFIVKIERNFILYKLLLLFRYFLLLLLCGHVLCILGSTVQRPSQFCQKHRLHIASYQNQWYATTVLLRLRPIFVITLL